MSIKSLVGFPDWHEVVSILAERLLHPPSLADSVVAVPNIHLGHLATLDHIDALAFVSKIRHYRLVLLEELPTTTECSEMFRVPGPVAVLRDLRTRQSCAWALEDRTVCRAGIARTPQIPHFPPFFGTTCRPKPHHHGPCVRSLCSTGLHLGYSWPRKNRAPMRINLRWLCAKLTWSTCSRQ